MRLGCLPYLNIKPLVWTFENGGLPDGWELVYAPPSKLAQMLKNGEIDAAPVSSFACFIDPKLEICPGICIAADGPVRSVLLLSKKDINNLSTIALDTSSLSGANMLKVILKDLYTLEPSFISLPPAPISAMLQQCDAALVIGNPAMTYPQDGLIVLDVAEEWVRLTGLPAVFAVWAGRMSPKLIRALQQAKEEGMIHIKEIAKKESQKLGLPTSLCEDYLSNIMIYDLGDREIQGLEMFRTKAIEHGLIQDIPPIGTRIYDCE